MKEFFLIKKNKEKLLDVIESWVGVPYVHMGETKRGIDCTKLIAAVFYEMGVLTDFQKGEYYQDDWYRHSKEDKVLNSFSDHIRKFLRKDLMVKAFSYDRKKDSLLFGDVLCFKYDKSKMVNHTGFYLENFVFHAATDSIVKKEQWRAAYKRLCHYYYRLYLKD